MGQTALERDGSTTVNVGRTERDASVLAGAALLLFGLSRKSLAGFGVAALGGGLIARGATGFCPLYSALDVDMSRRDTQGVVRASRSVRVDEAITVAKKRSELYDFWRDFENLPTVMRGVESVERLGDGRSRWRVKGPLPSPIEWEAEIVNDVPGELIAWRTVDGFEVAHAGSVLFKDAPGLRGTIVRVELEYSPIGGRTGAAIARLLGEDAGTRVADDLRRFKQIIEAGELPTVEGQPTGAGRSATHG